jgi:plasmid stabilization system protein ParE
LKYRLTRHADADILQILRTTKRFFGKAQVTVYADIIARGIAMIAEDAQDRARRGWRRANAFLAPMGETPAVPGVTP